MKKNKMMRLSAILLVAVLLSLSVISGTWAKYVTSGDPAEQTVTVAAWGVTVETVVAEAGVFNAGTGATETAVIVAAEANNYIMAPGTQVKLFNFKLSGTPEVASKLTYEANLEFTGNWVIEVEEEEETYCPVKFVINDTPYTLGAEETLEDFVTRIEGVIEGLNAEFAANTNLAAQNKNLEIICVWEFEGENEKDTKLAANTPSFELAVTCEVVQLDTYTAPQQN